jgi:hypothetical protein
MGKIKRFKRIALRCEKTARNYASFLALVCGFILIKSVHTALAPFPTCTLPVTVTFVSVQVAPAGTVRLPLIVVPVIGPVQGVSAARAAGTAPARIPRAASGVMAKRCM